MKIINYKIGDITPYTKNAKKHPEDKSKNCFFIRTTTAVEFLLDERHAANNHLTAGEKEQLEEAVQNLSNMA